MAGAEKPSTRWPLGTIVWAWWARYGRAFAGAACAGLLLALVLAVGVQRTDLALEAEAVERAERWSRTALTVTGDDARDLVARAHRGEIGRSMEAAGVLEAVLIGRTGKALAESRLGSGDRFRDAVGEAPVRQRAAYGAATATLKRVDAASAWAVVPAGDAVGAPRLAVHVDQTELAARLAGENRRNLMLFSGLIALAFFSFMAGRTWVHGARDEDSESLRYLAHHDPLTGLANRKRFESTLSRRLTSDDYDPSGILLLDLDGFKAINDSMGHGFGDRLLIAVAKRLSATLRGGDIVARLAGDEFAILVTERVEPKRLNQMGDRIVRLLRTPVTIDGKEVMISSSIGIALAPENGHTVSELMRNADFALYQAKNTGRDRCCFFDPKMAEELHGRQTIEDGLRRALEEDQFELAYQPKFDIERKRMTSCEALLRWKMPGRPEGKSLIPTMIFLAVAEETGLIVPIGEWVIRRAIADAARLPEDVGISVNLSAAQLKRHTIDQTIAEALKCYGVNPARIECEVTEGILGRNQQVMFDRLTRIKALGVKVAMDNFGTGTSSLGLLSSFPFDKVKIDRSYTAKARTDEKARAVVVAICQLGHSLGMQVAGEGVETDHHATILRASGCDEVQGHLYGKPQPIDTILEVYCQSPPGRAKGGHSDTIRLVASQP